jgi:hypothetical protein
MKRSHLLSIGLNNTKKKSVKISLLPITMDNTWRKSTLTIKSKQPPHLGMKKLLRRFFCEPSLEDPLGEQFDQFGGDLDLDKLLEHVEIFCEPCLEDPSGELFDQFGDNLDLDKLLEHVETFNEPSLEDPLGEHFDQTGCNLDLDKFLKQVEMFSEPSLEDPLEEHFA